MADHRIRWNGEEKALLAGKAHELIRNGVTRPLEALRKAQTVLPRNRRRTILHLGQVPWFRHSSPQSSAAAAERSGRAAMLANGSSADKTHPGTGAREALVEAVADFFREVIDRMHREPRSRTAAARRRRTRKASGR